MFPRGHRPERVKYLHLELRCCPQTVGDGAWATNSVFPHTLPFPGAPVWTLTWSGTSLLLPPPTHLSFLKARPWDQGHGCQSRP